MIPDRLWLDFTWQCASWSSRWSVGYSRAPIIWWSLSLITSKTTSMQIRTKSSTTIFTGFGFPGSIRIQLLPLPVVSTAGNSHWLWRTWGHPFICPAKKFDLHVPMDLPPKLWDHPQSVHLVPNSMTDSTRLSWLNSPEYDTEYFPDLLCHWIWMSPAMHCLYMLSVLPWKHWHEVFSCVVGSHIFENAVSNAGRNGCRLDNWIPHGTWFRIAQGT